MQLTRYTDYGLRIMTYLALLPRDVLATSDLICQAYQLKPNHISKIVNQLSREKLIETRRGKGGGFKLAKNSNEINLGVLIAILEGRTPIVECNEPICVISQQCRLKRVFSQALDAFYQVLDGYTLADLVMDNQRPLIEVLNLSRIDDGVHIKPTPVE